MQTSFNKVHDDLSPILARVSAKAYARRQISFLNDLSVIYNIFLIKFPYIKI